MVSKVVISFGFCGLWLGCGHEVTAGLLLQVSLLQLGMFFFID
jgi:hypothetical protein